tara:strand:- start:3928 stop:5211 length:1284 start_codon:yes stop_codon:yes gene_type:complete
MTAFRIDNSQLLPPTIRESISRGAAGINQIAAGAPLPTVALVGGIVGGLNSGNLRGVVEGAAGALIGNALSGPLASAAGALQGITNPAAFVENLGFVSPSTLAAGNVAGIASDRVTIQTGAPGTDTYSGTTNAENPSTLRTEIIDATTNTVELMKDSFLQGLQGGLSSLIGSGLAGILGNLPGVMGNLLSSTGLSGALGSALGAIDGALGNALGAVSGALGDMAGKLANGLGAAISSIPGVGPVFGQFTKGIGEFTKNLTGALNGLPPNLKGALSNAAFNVGANLVGKLTNKSNITSSVGKNIANKILFNDDPRAQLNNMANLAKQIDRKTFKNTNDPAFADMASACKKCAKQFGTRLVKKNSLYGISIKQQVEEETVLGVVVNGQVFTMRSTEFDRLTALTPETQSVELSKFSAASQSAFAALRAG